MLLVSSITFIGKPFVFAFSKENLASRTDLSTTIVAAIAGARAFSVAQGLRLRFAALRTGAPFHTLQTQLQGGEKLSAHALCLAAGRS